MVSNAFGMKVNDWVVEGDGHDNFWGEQMQAIGQEFKGLKA